MSSPTQGLYMCPATACCLLGYHHNGTILVIYISGCLCGFSTAYRHTSCFHLAGLINVDVTLEVSVVWRINAHASCQCFRLTSCRKCGKPMLLMQISAYRLPYDLEAPSTVADILKVKQQKIDCNHLTAHLHNNRTW